MSVNFTFDEQFYQSALPPASIDVNANLDFQLGGTNAVEVNSTNADNGGNEVRTGALLGDSVIVSPHTNVNQSSLLLFAASTLKVPMKFRFVFNVEPNAVPVISTTGTTSCFGIRPTVAGAAAFDTTTDDNKVIIRAVRTSALTVTNYQLVISNNGADLTVDTGIPYLTNRPYDWTIEISNEGIDALGNVVSGLTNILGYVVRVTESGVDIINSPNTFPAKNEVLVYNPDPVTTTGTILGKPFIGLLADVAVVGGAAATISRMSCAVGVGTQV